MAVVGYAFALTNSSFLVERWLGSVGAMDQALWRRNDIFAGNEEDWNIGYGQLRQIYYTSPWPIHDGELYRGNELWQDR